jgi:hypothetical protein
MNITANGNYPLAKSKGAAQFSVGLNDRTQAGVTAGAWGNATAYLQYKNEEGNWVDHPGGTFTANFLKTVDALAENYRLVIAGGTSVDLDMDENGTGPDWRV